MGVKSWKPPVKIINQVKLRVLKVTSSAHVRLLSSNEGCCFGHFILLRTEENCWVPLGNWWQKFFQISSTQGLGGEANLEKYFLEEYNQETRKGGSCLCEVFHLYWILEKPMGHGVAGSNGTKRKLSFVWFSDLMDPSSHRHQNKDNWYDDKDLLSMKYFSISKDISKKEWERNICFWEDNQSVIVVWRWSSFWGGLAVLLGCRWWHLHKQS